MGDSESKSKGSRFLSKSKWGKVLQTTPNGASGSQDAFKLNEDVVDFLKPSTDRASSTRQNFAPKIDVAIAQRWPDANEVRRASEAQTQAQTPLLPLGTTKPKRRHGLKVGFVKNAPEIIGEGGDDALEPVSEISRRKASKMRSVSDATPPSQNNGASRRANPAPGLPSRLAQPPSGPEADFPPQPMRRVQTSHNEMSPPVQRKHASPRLDPQPHRATRSRTPTGLDAQDESDRNDHQQSMIDTNLAREPVSMYPTTSYSPQSPVVAKRKDMQAGEGMALRRASAMFMHDEADGDEKDLSTGIQPSQRFYNDLSEPVAVASTTVAPWRPGARSPPQSNMTSEAPSRFADSNYISSHSGHTAFTPGSGYSEVPQSLRTPRGAGVTKNDHILLSEDEALGPSAKVEQPSYMHAGVQPLAKPRQIEQPSYMRAIQPSNGDTVQHRPAPVNGQNMHVPQDRQHGGSPSPLRDRNVDSNAGLEKSREQYAQPIHSNGSFNRLPASTTSEAAWGHVLEDPHAGKEVNNYSNQATPSSGMSAVQQDRPHDVQPSPRHLSTQYLPYSKAPESAPSDYFAAAKASPGQPSKSPVISLRSEDAQRPTSSGSSTSASRASLPRVSPPQGDAAGESALADFSERVAHMKGVFRLTAEKERAAELCSSQDWLRAAVWWYLKGKAGLESLLQQKSRNADGRRELLHQPHVDLAKAWWIMTDPLEPYGSLHASRPPSLPPNTHPQIVLQQSVAVLRSRLKSLCLAVARDHLMPPHQSLIQGQDTRIWLEYPRFTTDAAAVLAGSASTSLIADSAVHQPDALEVLPLGDMRDMFCYGRFAVEVSLTTDEAETDRVVLPCMLTMTRSRRDYQPAFVIASQSELVSVRVGPPQQQSRGLTWSDVSWKSSASSMVINLPRGFDLTVRMQERDFRSLWNLVEYSRKLEHGLRAGEGERLAHEARLAELQYADTSNANAFPQDKVRNCLALVFEQTVEHRDGSGTRKMQRGHRMVLVTEPGHKSLSTVSHELCRRVPLYFEFMTDATAGGTTAMVIRVREETKQSRMLLVFPDMATRQALYDALNGLTVGPDEAIAGRMSITALDVRPAFPSDANFPSGHPPSQALQKLQWQKLGITNDQPDDPNSRISETVESESLRVIVRHAGGCITDRMNLGKGELQFRLHCSDAHTVELLRQPQEDLSMALDTRNLPPAITDGMTELLHTIQQLPTIRTFTFASAADLHAFQTCITGYTVKHDSVASTLGISRRMMVVPIHYKQQASNIRIQVVAKGGVVQFVAFMEDFHQAAALAFQVKSTDTFERVKGDGKGKKWAIKMVDAKFSLPAPAGGEKKGEGEGQGEEEVAVRRRFVNLEGLEYAAEHCDITVGFDTEEERDEFAQALPAATTVGRMITLKRRI